MNSHRLVKAIGPTLIVTGIPPKMCPTCWDEGSVVVLVKREPSHVDQRLTWETIACPVCKGGKRRLN